MSDQFGMQEHRDNATFIMVYEDAWQALLGDPHALAVYVALRRRTHPGSNTWYSTNSRMAREAGVGVSTFKNKVKKLRDIGLIEISPRWHDPIKNEYSKVRTDVFTDQKGNLYDVREHLPPTTVGGQQITPPGQQVSDPRPADNRPPGIKYPTPGQQMSTDIYPLHRPPTQTTDIDPPVVPQGGVDRFDEFWSVVPKKVGKQAAIRAWKKAIKSTSPDVIIEGMRRYRDDPNRSDAFTKNPQGWLNDGRWSDDPLPGRESRAKQSKRSNTMEAWLGVSPDPQQTEITPPQSDPFGFDVIDHEDGLSWQ